MKEKIYQVRDKISNGLDHYACESKIVPRTLFGAIGGCAADLGIVVDGLIGVPAKGYLGALVNYPAYNVGLASWYSEDMGPVWETLAKYDPSGDATAFAIFGSIFLGSVVAGGVSGYFADHPEQWQNIKTNVKNTLDPRVKE